MKEYYQCIGEEATFLFTGKPKINLTIKNNKNKGIIIYGNNQNLPDRIQKECGVVSKEFFERNFVKQESFIESDNKITLENTIELYKSTYKTIKILMLDVSKHDQKGTLTDTAFNKYIAKIRKEFDILNRIQPTIKELKKK